MLDTHLQSAGLAYKIVLNTSSETVSERGRLVLLLRLQNKGFMQVTVGYAKITDWTFIVSATNHVIIPDFDPPSICFR